MLLVLRMVPRVCLTRPRGANTSVSVPDPRNEPTTSHLAPFTVLSHLFFPHQHALLASSFYEGCTVRIGGVCPHLLLFNFSLRCTDSIPSRGVRRRFGSDCRRGAYGSRRTRKTRRSIPSSQRAAEREIYSRASRSSVYPRDLSS